MDESGDDGFPKYSSEIFVLTSVYMDHQVWKNNYTKLMEFRRFISKNYHIPVKLELKIHDLLHDKNPYREMCLKNQIRVEIFDKYFQMLTQLELKIINVVINKKNITLQEYSVLEKALTYNIQRIENDLKENSGLKKFMIITDEGRLNKMRDITRKIQKVNFIPSIYQPQPYRKEIECMIEDPLSKNSKESYFIQIADTIAWVVYEFARKKYLGLELHKRLQSVISFSKLEEWLKIIYDSGVINKKASRTGDYGIVVTPK